MMMMNNGYQFVNGKIMGIFISKVCFISVNRMINDSFIVVVVVGCGGYYEKENLFCYKKNFNDYIIMMIMMMDFKFFFLLNKKLDDDNHHHHPFWIKPKKLLPNCYRRMFFVIFLDKMGKKIPKQNPGRY
mgnify:CR=1 FL=1